MALDQAGYRWRLDDGNEAGATWMEDQNTNIQRWRNSNVRLRMLVDATGNPPGAQFRLEYRKKGTTQWYVVETGEPSSLPSASPSVSPTQSPSSSLSPSKSKSKSKSLSKSRSKSLSHTPSATSSATPSPSASPSGGDAYTDLVLFWRCEGTTLGAGDTYGTDNTVTLVSDAAVNAAAVKIGTNGLNIPTSNDTAELTNNDEYITSEGRFGAWIKINTWAAGLAFLTANDGVAENVIEFYLAGADGTGNLSTFWKDSDIDRTILTSTGANLASATWYFIELAWKESTNYREIFVDGVSRGSSSATIGAWSAPLESVIFGDTWWVNGGSGYYMDNIMLSTLSTRNLEPLKNLTSTPKP